MNDKSATTFNPHTLDALWQLQKIILDTPDFEGVVERVVNSILVELGYLQLGYRILVLTLVDSKTKTLKRIALSQTPEADKALSASPIPFKQIAIPLDAEDNLLIRSLKEKKVHIIHSWPDIFRPILTSEEAIRNQEAAGIKTSMLYPIVVKDEAIGVLILSMIKEENEVSEDEKTLIARFTDIVGLAVQNSKLYTIVKESAEELQNANEKLKALDKLKDEFVSLASHELRTPMTSVKSYLWMTLQGDAGVLNDTQKLYLNRAYNSVNRLIKLVNDMLNISRIESGRITIELQKVDLYKLTEEVIAEVQPKAAELGVHLVISPPSPLPPVLADPDKIKEVLFNLIGNSLKFTPKDGSITVSFSQKGDMVEALVSDTGAGISPENLSKLFQKFTMLPESYANNKSATGTGLGLYISRAIMQLHKGDLWAASDGLAKGSKFYFSLKMFQDKDLDEFSSLRNADEKQSLGIVHTQL